MSVTGTIASKSLSPAARGAERLLLRLNTQGITADGEVTAVLIHNLSATGLLIETDLDLPLGETLLVDLPECGKTPATVVWQSDALVGCAFVAPLTEAALSAAQLRNPIRHDLDLDRLAGTAPFGERLRYLRERRGLSRSGLAALTSLSAPTLWSWETGKSQPRRKSLETVASALNVAVDELLHGRPVHSAPDEKLHDPPQNSGSHEDLESVFRHHKKDIADALGIDPRLIKITVEF